MKLPIAYYGNPILRKKGERVTEVTPEIRQLVSDMIETMKEYDGIGLAAPQVFRSLALFIVAVPIDQPDGSYILSEPQVFINPKIVDYSKESWIRGEGCLSLPKVYGEVVRPNTIRVKATDLDGNEFEKEYAGLEARIIMHENDHINGILFIDRMHGKKRKELEPALQNIKRMFNK